MSFLPRSRFGALLLGMAALLWASPAGAERRSRSGQPNFWSEIANPGRGEHDEAMRRGHEAFGRALGILAPRVPSSNRRNSSRVREAARSRAQRRQRLMESSLLEFRRAARAVPDSGLAHYWVGRAARYLKDWKLTISSLRRARSLDPQLTDDQRYLLSCELAHALGISNRSEEALREYDQALRLLKDLGSQERLRLSRNPYRLNLRRERGRLLGNSAEFLMALGRLDDALRRYHEAARLNPIETLHQWGLAVAYDRDEQFDKALEYARQAVSRGKGIHMLTADRVSFAPAGELNYYQAMGYLALGHFERARRKWRAYLEQLPDSPWAFRARAHLAQKVRSPADISKRLAPAPGTNKVDHSQHDRTRIRLVVRNKLRPVFGCYDAQLKRRANLAGRLRISLEILPEGKLKRAKVVYSTVDHPPLHRCVLKVIQGLRFPRLHGKKTVKMEYTFNFKPVS